jgi:excisionase family DNA binding protein
MEKNKDVLTTGQVAKICNVAPRTVSKWFDTGQLRGYRIPGSKDRRIPVHQLVRFMKAHGMPLEGLETGQVRVLVVEEEQDLVHLLQRALADEAGYEVRTAASAFEAGVEAGRFRPHVILLDMSLPGVAGAQLCRYIRSHPELQGTRLIAVETGIDEGRAQALRQDGFDSSLQKPFEIRQLISTIEEAIAVVY